MENGILDLYSSKSTWRLEQIARLRASGIGDHINLPQLVVCGDQSAGKSSVLEGITGLPFPRQDGVCTKFATEIILQHTSDCKSIVATILPTSSRSDSSKAQLRAYRRLLEDFTELPSAIAEVGCLLGLKGFGGNEEGPAFVEDVFRIEVSGPTSLHLTVVDLPGLISVASEEQTDDDVELVQKLVDSYAANPRTIILAVVQAGNDIANQGVIRKSRKFDPVGKRTVGIITKPDLINKGTERRIAMLAKNQDTTKLKLGFFLIKNPTPLELENGITAKERQASEIRFFQSTPWREQALNMDRVGILSLRAYLQTLLDQHIERELPKVIGEIKSLLATTQKDIIALGDDRPTTAHLRMFLARIAMRYHGLATSALNGTYHEADSVFFGNNEAMQSRRLRAVLHRLNTNFSDHMRDNGQKRRVVAQTLASPSMSDTWSEHGEILVTEQEMKEWVKEIYLENRGKELPGNYNHVLLSELFHIQSSRWQTIATNHVDELHQAIKSFVEAALCHIVKDEHTLHELVEMTSLTLNENKEAADEELDRLCRDEQEQPITYNHYYTDNVQNSRTESTRKLIRKAMNETTAHDWNGKLHVSNNTVDAEKLLASLQRRIVVDMDDQACAEALAGLTAYYKVALKTFVDNVARQVVERHLVRSLPTIFGPERVALLDDEELGRIAAESSKNVEQRQNLRQLRQMLEKSLQDLRTK